MNSWRQCSLHGQPVFWILHGQEGHRPLKPNICNCIVLTLCHHLYKHTWQTCSLCLKLTIKGEHKTKSNFGQVYRKLSNINYTLQASNHCSERLPTTCITGPKTIFFVCLLRKFNSVTGQTHFVPVMD